MKYVLMRYKSDGSMMCYKTFMPTYSPFKFMKNVNKATFAQVQPTTVPFPQVSQAKMLDVRGLMKYLTVEDQNWLEQLLAEIG